jgi:hypothetical protein
VNCWPQGKMCWIRWQGMIRTRNTLTPLWRKYFSTQRPFYTEHCPTLRSKSSHNMDSITAWTASRSIYNRYRVSKMVAQSQKESTERRALLEELHELKGICITNSNNPSDPTDLTDPTDPVDRTRRSGRY